LLSLCPIAKKNLILHEKNSFPVSLSDMHVNGFMVIAVEEKSVAVFLEDSGRIREVAGGCKNLPRQQNLWAGPLLSRNEGVLLGAYSYYGNKHLHPVEPAS
jgi:hypothetical protein